MKAKLLKKIRTIGRDQVHIHSVTKTNGTITRMSYGFNDDCYRGLFTFGQSEEEVLQKACNIYLKNNIDSIRKNYSKYSSKFRRTGSFY